MQKRGIALILVISILTVVAITVVSFIFTMRLERRVAANYLWQVKAGYLAEAGIVHAQAVLKEDKRNNYVDSYHDAWRTEFGGNDVDNDGDGVNDSRWIEVSANGELLGRYAVLVEDETAKLNVNTAGWHNESPLKVTQGATPFEVSMEDFFQAKGIPQAQGLASAIINDRYGEDQAPGIIGRDDNQNSDFLSNDGIDNNADGQIDEPGEGTDEPQEFSSLFYYGDDRPFFTNEQIKRIETISPAVYEKLKSAITAHSRVASINYNRDLQWDVNSITADQLLDVLLESRVSLPWQKAVNIIDFLDLDLNSSVLIRSSDKMYTTDSGPKGDWQWVNDHYEGSTFSGAPGTWTWWGITAGRYYVIAYGSEANQPVGDMTINAVTHSHMESGQIFIQTVTVSEEPHPFYPQGGVGSLTVSIKNNEAPGTTCYFKYLELIDAEGGVQSDLEEIRGTEGIRINEVMVRPVEDLPTSAVQSPGGDWVWQEGYYENAMAGGGKNGRGTWIWYDIPDGEYYLTVYAASGGQSVGDVLADGAKQENMVSGERFTARETVTVNGGVFRLEIENNLGSGSCFFESITLSQQPDAEYIELVNLTPNQICLDGWSVEAPGIDGWPANIPLGTNIAAHSYLILAVDKKDKCPGIDHNKISFEDVWGKVEAVQLDFSRSVADYSDMLADTPLQGASDIILRDNYGNIVDIQQYPSTQTGGYISWEKGDPTYIAGTGAVWFASEDLTGATPGEKNNNEGIFKLKDGETIEHEMEEIEIKNRPLANLGQLSQVSVGGEWEKLALSDLMSFADMLTVYSLRLEAEGHKEGGGWSEQLRSAPYTCWYVSQTGAEEGLWLWDEGIPNGVYTLYIFGENNEAISVSLHLADDTWTSFTPPLTPVANNAICLGRVEIGTENAGALPEGRIEMRVKNASVSNTAHFDYISLGPLPYVSGKINLNTAPVELLQALPKIDSATAQRIISYRPLGNKDMEQRGIGDILLFDILDDDAVGKQEKFNAISNLITVQSDTYQIIATAQVLRNERVIAEKRIRAVFER